LQKGGLAGLPGGVESPIELITDIPLELGAYQSFLRGKHIVPFRVTRAGRVKKVRWTFCGVHGLSIPRLSSSGKFAPASSSIISIECQKIWLFFTSTPHHGYFAFFFPAYVLPKTGLSLPGGGQK
jgi:hypothetical protein